MTAEWRVRRLRWENAAGWRWQMKEGRGASQGNLPHSGRTNFLSYFGFRIAEHTISLGRYVGRQLGQSVSQTARLLQDT